MSTQEICSHELFFSIITNRMPECALIENEVYREFIF